jgi:hypothetical protein
MATQICIASWSSFRSSDVVGTPCIALSWAEHGFESRWGYFLRLTPFWWTAVEGVSSSWVVGAIYIQNGDPGSSPRETRSGNRPGKKSGIGGDRTKPVEYNGHHSLETNVSYAGIASGVTHSDN